MPTARFLTTVNIRTMPSISTNIVGIYYNGDTFNYDYTVENEGRLWITYIANSGIRRYCCAKDTNGDWYISINQGGGRYYQGIQIYQKNSRHNAVRREGCCFLAACYLGGLNNISECDDCFDWAVNCGKVRKRDSYVNIEKHSLGREIAQKYGRACRSGTIVKGNNHFYVMDGRREVFNSMGVGWGH